MSLLEINIGTFANDGTGDDLREAFNKVNLNFQELDLRDDESTTATNLGVIGEGIFAQKLNYDLQFKKLVAGKDISLSSTDERIIITANGGVKSLLLGSDAGTTLLQEVANLNIYGGNNIQTSLVNNTLTIDFTGSTSLVTDTDPRLGANLDAQGRNISNVGNIDANSVTSNFYGSVYSTDNSTTLVNANTKVIDLSNTSITGLKDVNINPSSLQVGHVLKWDGVSFISSPDIYYTLISSSVFDLGDVGEVVNNPTDNQYLKWDTDKFVLANNPSVKDLEDVENYLPGNILNGQTLIWNGTKWEPGTVAGTGSTYGVTNNFDFGSAIVQITSMEEYLYNQLVIDMGTFTNPSAFDIDLGSI